MRKVLEKYQGKVDLVILDVWGDYLSGEHNNKETRTKLNELNQLMFEHHLQCLIVHHTNKKGGDIPQVSSIKGATDFDQKLRMVSMISNFQGVRYLSKIKTNELDSIGMDISYRIDLNPKTQRIIRGQTNKKDDLPPKMSRTDLIRLIKDERAGPITSPNFKGSVDWEALDCLKSGSGYPDLIEAIKSQLGCGNSTAKARISEALGQSLIEDDEGFYWLMGESQARSDP